MKALLEVLRPGEMDWDLAQAIDPTRLPEHIAIIMDGNGRWAGRRRLPRVAGHKAGIGPVRTTVETCARLGVKALTLYAFSIENWKRPRHEVETLWRLLRYYLRRELPDLLIRTSGEMRISNFLLWQIAYAELYITETLWPDFSRTDLLQAVLEYQKRDRRYGGLSGARLNAPVNGAAQPPGPNLLEALRPA